MPGYIFHHSCFFLFFFLENETLYTKQVLAVFDFYYRMQTLSVKTVKTRTFYFVLSLRIFVSAHVTVT